MYVLPATGLCGLVGTDYPMGKPDLQGEPGDSRGGGGEGLWNKGKTEIVREPKGSQEVMRKEERDYFYFPGLSLPLPVLHSEPLAS